MNISVISAVYVFRKLELNISVSVVFVTRSDATVSYVVANEAIFCSK